MNKKAFLACLLIVHVTVYPAKPKPPIFSRQFLYETLKAAAIGFAISESMKYVLEMVRYRAARPMLFQYPMLVPRDLKLVAPETVPARIREMANLINSGHELGKRILILYGSAGTGKTTSIKWLAQQTGCKLLYENGGNINNEENFNDRRKDFDAIQWILGRAAPSWLDVIKRYASRMKTRFWRSNIPESRKPTIILIDEGDSFFTDPHKLSIMGNILMRIDRNILWCITTNLREENINAFIAHAIYYFLDAVQAEFVPLPDEEQRGAICRFYAADYPEHSFASDINFNQMPHEGLSGADIKYAIQHAWARASLYAQNSQSRPMITNELMTAKFQERQYNHRLIPHLL